LHGRRKTGGALVRKRKVFRSKKKSSLIKLPNKLALPDDWDNRFSVLNSKDNRRIHTFYKEFFDKEPFRRDKKILEPRKGGTNHSPKNFFVKEGSRLPKYSRMFS
jgi:hypothetical protein